MVTETRVSPPCLYDNILGRRHNPRENNKKQTLGLLCFCHLGRMRARNRVTLNYRRKIYHANKLEIQKAALVVLISLSSLDKKALRIHVYLIYVISGPNSGPGT